MTEQTISPVAEEEALSRTPIEPEEATEIRPEPSVLAEGEAAVSPDGAPPSPVEETDYEALAASDLAEIKRLDPTYAPAAHLCELPFAARFAALRDMGLSVTEALAAVTPRFSPHDTRSHLRASSPGGARSAGGFLSREELKEAKGLFSDLSERELHALYRRVTAEE